MIAPKILKFTSILFVLCLLWTSTCLSEPTVDPKNLPSFLGQVPNITRTIGRDAKLHCHVDHLKGYKVAWVQVDTQTILTIHQQVITRNPRISLAKDDHKSWHLQIKDIQEQDRGWYMCQVNTDPMRYVQGYLDVVVPPDIIDKETSGDMIIQEGDDVDLKCKARGHPAPRILWRRENNEDIVLDDDRTAIDGTVNDVGKSYPNGESMFTVPKVEGEVLSMKKVSRLQMGSYLCIASNDIPPSISKRIQLKIHFPPVAWVPQQLEGAYVGQEMTIECHTEAYPDSINYWMNNNGDMIVSGGRFNATTEQISYKVNMKLVIYRIQKEDFGTFKCLAKNSLGETDGVIRLYEMEPPSTHVSKTVDYEVEDYYVDTNVASSTPTNHKRERSKFDDISKGINEFVDRNQLAKERNKNANGGRDVHRKRPSKFHFEASDAPRWSIFYQFLLISQLCLYYNSHY